MKFGATLRIGEWIKAARKEANISQDKLGELLGVTKANVSAWENGRHEPSFEQLGKIGEVTRYPLPAALRGVGNVEPTSMGVRRIPVLDYVQAGTWTGVNAEISESDIRDFVLTSLELSPNAFAMYVRGDSMEPEFREGDLIVVEYVEITPSRPGDCVVAVNGSGEATFKRYRDRGLNDSGQNVFELVPLNPDYPTMRSDVTHIRIIGTMVEHRKFRRK